ncbi:MAG: hypothetical protein AB7G17_11640 [Phycisphaerales bacterium]
MTSDQLRQALAELNGERDLEIVLAEVANGAALKVKRAILIPHEKDDLVKVTDGQAVFILDAARVAALKIGTVA